MASEKKKVGFLDLKRNLTGILAIIAIITATGWYFGFNWNDFSDVAESIATAAKPDLPVEVLYRESLVGKGYVATIKNTSTERLPVEINLRDPDAKNKKADKTILSPNQTLAIGWLEGWEFNSGDVIKISNPEYQTGVYAIK